MQGCQNVHPQFEAHNQLAAFERVKLWADCCFGPKLGPLDTRHLKGLSATRDRDCQQVDIFVPFWQIPPRVRNGIYCFWRISRGGEKRDWQPSAPRRRATLQLPCKDGTDIRALISQLPMLSGGRKWETAFGRKDKRHKDWDRGGRRRARIGLTPGAFSGPRPAACCSVLIRANHPYAEVACTLTDFPIRRYPQRAIIGTIMSDTGERPFFFSDIIDKACSSQIQSLSNSTEITTNIETTMLSTVLFFTITPHCWKYTFTLCYTEVHIYRLNLLSCVCIWICFM